MSFHFPFESAHLFALLVALLIFLVTILLVVKRWIGFPTAFLLLLFALFIGILINYQHDLGHYFSPSTHPDPENSGSTESFQKNILQAIEDLKTEVAIEKENLRKLGNEVKDIFDSVDAQKQKLQNFIEEVREQFKSENHPLSPSQNPEKPSENNV